MTRMSGMKQASIAVLDRISPIVLSPAYRTLTALSVLFLFYLIWNKPPFRIGPPPTEDPWSWVRGLIQAHSLAWVWVLYYDLRKKGL
jgi:hypothetical protein